VVVDVMGALLAWYGVADVAFVGGSLVAHGGHNPIEPALCGAPVLMGPSVFNFEDVVAALRDGGALTPVADGEALTAALAEAFDDPAAARDRGARGRQVVAGHGGASARLSDLIAGRIAALGAAEDNRPALG
jgi:3-deoxy-D-manno-octulosonic-acid transferase